MSLSGVVLQAKRAQSGRGLMGGVAGEMTKQAVTTVGAVTHQTRALVRDKLGGGGVAQDARVPTALTEDPGSAPSTQPSIFRVSPLASSSPYIPLHAQCM